MTLRPMDVTGDIQPVSAASKMCSGADAVGCDLVFREKHDQLTQSSRTMPGMRMNSFVLCVTTISPLVIA